jgi:hypothetical protein
VPPLVVVTPYGREGGSSRVRVDDWLDHLGVTADVHDHREESVNGPKSMLRQPVSTVRAETGTRSVDLAGRRLLLFREPSPISGARLEARLLRSGAVAAAPPQYAIAPAHPVG